MNEPEALVKTAEIKTVGHTSDGWAINEYADEDGPRRCFYCQHAERKECSSCVDRSEFQPTEEAIEFRGLDR